VTAAAKPVLFMDVDGALIPYGTEPRRGYQPARLWGFNVIIGDHVIAAAPRLAEIYEWVWATTWEPDGVRQIEAHLGLPRLTNLDTRDHAMKLPAIREYMSGQEGRPMVWIDDRLRHDPQLKAGRRAATLLIRPHRDVGLTAQQVRRLLSVA